MGILGSKGIVHDSADSADGVIVAVPQSGDASMDVDGDPEVLDGMPNATGQNGATVTAPQLGCVIYLSGHLALRMLVFLEGLQSALKKKRLAEEDARMAEKREKKKEKKLQQQQQKRK